VNRLVRSTQRVVSLFALLIFPFLVSLSRAESGNNFVNDVPKPGEPTVLAARKAYSSAMDWEKRRFLDAAIGDYRKANKLDGGHCAKCMMHAYALSMKLGAFTTAVDLARDGLSAATNDKDRASLNYMLGNALYEQGAHNKKSALFAEGAEDLRTALRLDPDLTQAHYVLGMVLARQNKDAEARTEFQAFLDQDRKSPAMHERVERYLERVDLARANMAPPFTLTTIDGQRVSMDGLAGKVVLIDFWATWCAPCRDALPRIRSIAQKFQGQPLVVLSISLDADEAKWRDFVAKNKMVWLQGRELGFAAPIPKAFGVNAIPATFSIDADGVLEDQHVGDASIEGKLKKMVAQAVQAQAAAANGSAGIQQAPAEHK